jgi:hypothetical protein
MPTETIIMLAVVVAAFVLFAGTLAWADFTTGRVHQDYPAE